MAKAKVGIIHYNAPGDTLEQFLEYAAKTGYQYVELQNRDVWPDESVDPEPVAKAAAKAVKAAGLKVSALAAGNDFILLDGAAVAAQVERMKRMCELADIVGTKVIRTEGGRPKDEVPESRWLEAMAGCLKRCMEFAEPGGFLLAVDNHGHVTNDGALQVELFEKVGSKNVGANLDTMNYRWKGHDLATIDRFYEMVARYTFHTHLKDGRGSLENYQGEALGDGEVNLSHAVACLKKAGYKGVFTAEYEGDDQAGGYARCCAWIKAHC